MLMLMVRDGKEATSAQRVMAVGKEVFGVGFCFWFRSVFKGLKIWYVKTKGPPVLFCATGGGSSGVLPMDRGLQGGFPPSTGAVPSMGSACRAGRNGPGCIPMDVHIVCTYTHTYMDIHMHTHIHSQIYSYTYTHTYAHTHIYIYIYSYIHTYVYIHIYSYIHTHAYIHIYTCLYIYCHIYMCIYTCMCMYTHTHQAHMYTCMQIHRYTNTHTHIYI